MKSMFSHKNGVFSFEGGMFPSQKGCSVEKISASYMCLGHFFIITVYSPPLKVSDRTLEKIPSQARTASSMFFVSWWFLLRLVVLVTDHTKPLESLNRGDRVVVPWYLIGGTWYIHLVELVPKAVELLPNLVEPVPNHVYLLHNYQNLREVPKTKAS